MQLNHPEVQQTIAGEVSISGVGIHSGQTVEMLLKPAEPNTGIIFRRVDLPNAPSVKADVDNVVETTRSTTIGALLECLPNRRSSATANAWLRSRLALLKPSVPLNPGP